MDPSIVTYFNLQKIRSTEDTPTYTYRSRHNEVEDSCLIVFKLVPTYLCTFTRKVASYRDRSIQQ